MKDEDALQTEANGRIPAEGPGKESSPRIDDPIGPPVPGSKGSRTKRSRASSFKAAVPLSVPWQSEVAAKNAVNPDSEDTESDAVPSKRNLEERSQGSEDEAYTGRARGKAGHKRRRTNTRSTSTGKTRNKGQAKSKAAGAPVRLRGPLHSLVDMLYREVSNLMPVCIRRRRRKRRREKDPPRGCRRRRLRRVGVLKVKTQSSFRERRPFCY